MSTIIVVGGGAAGMLAAITAADHAAKVILLEKNEKLGKKVFITGKGRCNVTNACEAETFFENVISNPKFLYSSFYAFDNHAVMDFFEKAGCPLKTERGERVFPVSDHSSDVIRTLATVLTQKKVEIRLNTKVESLLIKNETVTGVKLADGSKVQADAVILATGGISYPLTGSEGDGIRIAGETGHTVTEMKPALVPFMLKESFYQELQGLALKNAGAKLTYKGKVIYEGFGEMLFTHFGISGPLILSASSTYSKKIKNSNDEMMLTMDLKPALTMEQLDKRILRDFEENRNKQFKNAIAGLFPLKLIPVMIKESGIDPEKPVYQISREERKEFGHLIKNWNMTITGTRSFREAIITQGGVSVKDINPSTMESKRIKNLFFAGEMIDVDALTGGFNLQIAWSTGHLAGESTYKV
ncbi:MAG: NAD(P)/FAD-dependent oxidoreductase [Lachnospiraceae bacterium]|nr:NAD(P)/FAD-dependent oxidoreductase [Lachnospiraceae bacterium]MDD3660417.1 NAD(P)/FAD-dependent oxidoreductase [Lachnospiraceae bacterium]